MVPTGNALGVLSRKFLKNRCNAVDGTFYDAIKLDFHLLQDQYLGKLHSKAR